MRRDEIGLVEVKMMYRRAVKWNRSAFVVVITIIAQVSIVVDADAHISSCEPGCGGRDDRL